jgi:hypothetical protein
VELGDSEGEEEAPIKWQNYEIETFIAIRGEIEEEFAKFARKQGIFCIILIEVHWTTPVCECRAESRERRAAIWRAESVEEIKIATLTDKKKKKID